jgi:hypothetical protein
LKTYLFLLEDEEDYSSDEDLDVWEDDDSFTSSSSLSESWL